jgi:deazaflavin-dependent oxidoreductase (nitroreductase family)
LKPRGDSVAILTHFGRSSGKPYRVRVWWVEIDGVLWLGSLDANRSWVRNVRAHGRAEIDRGRGVERVLCEPATDAAEIARFRGAVKSKYPVLSRLLAVFFERDSCAFRTRPADSGGRP